MHNSVNKTIILLPILLMNACASVKETYTSEEKPVYTVDCSGGRLGWAACYEEAEKKCSPKGYEILEKQDEQSQSTSGSQYGSYGGSSINRSMVIQCKE
jgi:hypothetical protein